jgi:putative peptidoglycan lipid II flippase
MVYFWRTATLLVGLSVVSRITGLARDSVLAYTFGGGAQTDAYFTALMWPNIIAETLTLLVASAFLPIYTEVRERRGLAYARGFAGRFCLRLAGAVSVLALTLGLAAPWLIWAISPASPGGILAQAVALMRLMLLGTPLLAVVAAYTGVLNAHSRFAVPYLLPVVQNLTIVATLLGLSNALDIAGAAVGHLAAAVLQLLVIAGAVWVWRLGPSELHPGAGTPEVKKTFGLVRPILVSVALGQAAGLADRIWASFLSSGSLTSLILANRVNTATFFVANTITLMIYTRLSTHAARSDHKAYQSELVRGLRLILFATGPIVMGLFIFREPLIILLFEHGRFDRADTAATVAAFQFYLLGAPALNLNELFTKAFCARQDTRTPVIMTGIGVACNLGLNFALVPRLGSNGLALSAALSYWVTLGLLAWSLHQRTRLSFRPLFRFALQAIAPAAAALAALYAGWELAPALWGHHLNPAEWFRGLSVPLRVTYLAASGAASAGVYLATAAWLRLPEAREVLRGPILPLRRVGEAPASKGGLP